MSCFLLTELSDGGVFLMFLYFVGNTCALHKWMAQTVKALSAIKANFT